MKKELKLLKEKLKTIDSKFIKKLTICLSVCAVIFTFCLFMQSGITKTSTIYKLELVDSFTGEDYAWKDKYTTSYNLKLHYVDTNGNSIEGSNLKIDIGPDTLDDEPYAFGTIPSDFDDHEIKRGKDLIDLFNIKKLTPASGEIYEFDHAEVLIDGTWVNLDTDSISWHILCEFASSTAESSYYGWNGRYGKDLTKYYINENTEYKLVYKETRYGIKKSISSLGSESGITFKLFNYSGDNTGLGDNNINNNGVYDYFSFKGLDRNLYGDFELNEVIDDDGYYNETRAKVENLLDSNGYPVFDCRGYSGCNNFSLGYLFGSNTNPLGNKVKGVTSYTPINTILQKDSLGYYYYDSNINATDYDTVNNRFMLRNYTERSYRMTIYEHEENRYEFLPFDYLNDYSTLKYSKTNNRAYNYEDNDTDHWFGMIMEFNFFMPKNGKIDGNDMIFSFSGDDDVWVFIDDVLVLDLGGTHGAVDGTINFATGEVNTFLNWNGVIGTVKDGYASSTNIYEMYKNANKEGTTSWNNNTYSNYTYHTLKFFYLERGANVSNCKIRFNLPVLESGKLTVEKKFNGVEPKEENYEFILYDMTSTKNPVKNTKYTINDKEYYTDDSGKFTLKANEKAIFVLNNNHKYIVEEANTGTLSESYSCTINDKPCTSKTLTSEFMIDPESDYKVVFTNTSKKFNLNIKKLVYPTNDNETFTFKLTLKDKNGDNVILPKEEGYEIDKNGVITFNLKNEENITIKNIPAMTSVSLLEVKHDGYSVTIKKGDITLSNNDTYSFTMDDDKEITVLNSRGTILPETGSIGIIWYLLIGISLMFISIKFRYRYLFNK